MPDPSINGGEQRGWTAVGERRHRGHLVTEELGHFASWIDADQACDVFHQTHRSSIRCFIKPNYEPEKEDA